MLQGTIAAKNAENLARTMLAEIVTLLNQLDLTELKKIPLTAYDPRLIEAILRPDSAIAVQSLIKQNLTLVPPLPQDLLDPNKRIKALFQLDKLLHQKYLKHNSQLSKIIELIQVFISLSITGIEKLQHVDLQIVTPGITVAAKHENLEKLGCISCLIAAKDIPGYPNAQLAQAQEILALVNTKVAHYQITVVNSETPLANLTLSTRTGITTSSIASKPSVPKISTETSPAFAQTKQSMPDHSFSMTKLATISSAENIAPTSAPLEVVGVKKKTKKTSKFINLTVDTNSEMNEKTQTTVRKLKTALKKINTSNISQLRLNVLITISKQQDKVSIQDIVNWPENHSYVLGDYLVTFKTSDLDIGINNLLKAALAKTENKFSLTSASQIVLAISSVQTTVADLQAGLQNFKAQQGNIALLTARAYVHAFSEIIDMSFSELINLPPHHKFILPSSLVELKNDELGRAENANFQHFFYQYNVGITQALENKNISNEALFKQLFGESTFGEVSASPELTVNLTSVTDTSQEGQTITTQAEFDEIDATPNSSLSDDDDLFDDGPIIKLKLNKNLS